MAQNKEIRLFTAFVYTIAIIFIASYIVLSKQTPEEDVTPHEKTKPMIYNENKTEGSPP